MLQTYVAKVTPCDNGWYDIEFPDLPGTHALAETLETIQQEAEGALCSFLYAASLVKEPVNAPSPWEKITLADGEAAVIVTVDMDAYLRRQDERPIKKTVSLPAWMAESADRAGLSLSKVLQESLKDRFMAR